ncbi:MAG: SCO family protein [bacterium]
MTEPVAQKRSWSRNPWLWAALAGIVLVPLTRPYCKRRTRNVPKPPPVLGTLPAFDLIDQHGKPFGSKELQGQVWVANFIFTTCRSICPRLTAQMSKLAERYKKAGVNIRLVSITVDPETDTPAKLKAFAETNDVDFRRWTWLTGPRVKIQTLLENGFKTHMGDKKKLNGLIDIAHTGRFALVDRKLGLRGLYHSDDKGIDEIFHRSQHVLNATR